MSRMRSATRAQPAPERGLSEGTDQRSAASARVHGSGRPARSVLTATHGSASEWLGERFGHRSPVLVFLLTTLAGYLILAGVMIGVGFLLVDVLLPVHAIGHNDEAVNEWLASNRTSSLNDASYVGSSIGDIPFIPALVILTALGALIMRRWRFFAFIVGAILVEVASYRVTSLIVHRERPTVPRLDHLPVNQSYPSGHVAASIVVYIGLALVLSAKLRDRRLTILLWTLAIALPLLVAASRMYRGMHHPIDAAAGAGMGLASIAIALFAARAAGEAARVRSERATGARR
jgi:membrane-associated phospholipid phosphatase